LAARNYFVFLDPSTALACFSLAAIAFVGSFWSRELSTLASVQRMESRLLIVFLVWWLGDFVARPVGPHTFMDTEGLFCGALLYAFLSRRNLGAGPLRMLSAGLVAGAAVTTIYAHYQYWIAIPRLQLWMPAHGLPGAFVAGDANFYSPNCYAPFLASVILLSGGLLCNPLTPLRRLPMFGLLLVRSVGLLLTMSRSTMGLLAIFSFGLILSVHRNWTRYMPLLVGMMPIIVIALACVVVLMVNLAELWSVGIEGRISIWRASLAMIREHWIFGVGLGRFGEFFPSYRLTDYYTRYPHNLLLEVFAETGIVGVASLVAFIALSLYNRSQESLLPVESTEQL
jgi:O-antigen ligase